MIDDDSKNTRKESEDNIDDNKLNENEPQEKKLDERKKILIEQVNQLILKDNKRREIKIANLNPMKKYDMMSFESVKYDAIQRVAKKFTKITEENKKEFLEDVDKYNFSKVLDEIIKYILDTKFEFKDVNSIILVVSELNQIYEGFNKKFFEAMKKTIKDYLDTIAKAPPKNEEDEEKRISRKKALFRLAIEAFLYGLFTDFNYIKDILIQLISLKSNLFQDFPILISLMRLFGEQIFSVKPTSVKKLIKDEDIMDYELNSHLNSSQAERYIEGFSSFYKKRVLIILNEEHKNLMELEKKNYENLKKLDSNNEIQNEYQKKRQIFTKLLRLTRAFAEIMDFEPPELSEEKIIRLEEGEKIKMKIEKINKFDPFADEVEFSFYNILINLKEKLDSELYETILAYSQNKVKEEESEIPKSKEKQFNDISNAILKADSSESIDEASIEYISTFYNNKEAWIRLKRSLLRSSKTNYAVLRYYSRFVSNISQLRKEYQSEICQSLIMDFNDLSREEVLNMNEERIKNIRFICEMIKFNLFPMQNVFEILKKLLDDFKGVSIDLLCNLMENAGRYLFLNEQSHLKFNSCLETIKLNTQYKLIHDKRAYNSIMNCILICKPLENTMKKKVKVRPIEEEYIRFLIFQMLNKDSVKKVAVILRRLCWETHENLIFKVIYKYLSKANENQIKYAASLLSLLKPFRQSIVVNLLNIFLEELRICLERNDFYDNQHKILICMILSHFYREKLFNSDIIFYVLYMILTYNPEWNIGRRELLADNPLDDVNDTIRIQMVVIILEIAGSILNMGTKKDRLIEFMHFLQIYVLSKLFLPLDVENRVTNCIENLFGDKNVHIYNDFTEALKDSKKFKGFNYEIDEDIKDETKKEEINEKNNDNSVNEFDRSKFKNRLTHKTDGQEDLRRLKEKEKINNAIDEDIQKIINESVLSAKKNASNNPQFISPLMDLNKKDKAKLNSSPTKFKIILKKDNKTQIKEIDKAKFNQ